MNKNLKPARKIHSSQIILAELLAQKLSVMNILENTKISGWTPYFAQEIEMSEEMAEELSNVLRISKKTLLNLT